MTSPLDQQILRRPVFVASFRADYYRLVRSQFRFEEPTQRMATRKSRTPKAAVLRRDRIACSRFQRRNKLATRGLGESSVGSSNCLLVGKITISVNGN